MSEVSPTPIDDHAGRCNALVVGWRARQSGETRCMNLIWSGGYCARHQDQVQKKTRGQQGIIEKYKKIGEPRRISPVMAMKTLLHEAAGNVEFYRKEVSKLQRLVIAGRKEREEVAKLVVLYNEERDRLERYTLDALRVRLDEQQIRLYDLQAQAMITVVKSVVDGLGLMGETRQKALTIAASQLSVYSAMKDQEWKGPFIEAERLAQVKVVDGRVINDAVESPSEIDGSVNEDSVRGAGGKEDSTDVTTSEPPRSSENGSTGPSDTVSEVKATISHEEVLRTLNSSPSVDPTDLKALEEATEKKEEPQ